MKLAFSAAIFCHILIGLNVAFHVPRETGCPPEEDVFPCKCTNSPYTYLECMNIENAEDLRSVFANSERYTYREVHLEYSNIQFLPHDMFEHTPVINLHLKNVTVIKLFDRLPESLDKVDNLFIENTRILSGMTWDLFQPLTQLRLLNIYYTSIKKIDSSFSQYISKNLEQITFYQTETRSIQPGVLSQFPKLNKIAFDECKLTELSRNMFAIPFYGRTLYFNNNKITTIPNDLFTQMPNLQTLGMRNNLITKIPESAFEGKIHRITYVMFAGNPLKCDCLLVWIVQNKPESLSGTCSSPRTLEGKQLADLSPRDFNC